MRGARLVPTPYQYQHTGTFKNKGTYGGDDVMTDD